MSTTSNRLPAGAAAVDTALGNPTYKYYVLIMLVIGYVINVADRGVFGSVLQSIQNELHIRDDLMGLVGGLAFSLFLGWDYFGFDPNNPPAANFFLATLQGGERWIEAALKRNHEGNVPALDFCLNLAESRQPKVQRLLAEDGQTPPRGSHDDLVVRVGRRRDHDRVEVVGVDDLPPVIGNAFDAEIARERRKVALSRVSPGDRLRAVDAASKMLRVDTAHPAGPQDADPQRVRGGRWHERKRISVFPLRMFLPSLPRPCGNGRRETTGLSKGS